MKRIVIILHILRGKNKPLMCLLSAQVHNRPKFTSLLFNLPELRHFSVLPPEAATIWCSHELDLVIVFTIITSWRCFQHPGKLSPFNADLLLKKYWKKKNTL